MNNRLKMTLLELLDASPRLQKRLASMSITSGKPIFHIDATDTDVVQEATSQMLPGIFFIKNLFACDPAHIKQLKEVGQVISFVKIEADTQKFLQKNSLNELLENVDCCVLFSDIAPLTNRLILGSLSQALANIAFSALPADFLYWGSWQAKWQPQNNQEFAATLAQIAEQLKLDSLRKKSLLELAQFGLTGFFKRQNFLKPVEFNCGCDGTLLVATVKYQITNQNSKYWLKLQRQIMKFEQDYLALDISATKDGYLTITKFIPVLEKKHARNHKLLMVFNSNEEIVQLMALEDKKAG